MNFDELKTEFKINFDSYDGFGSAMSALFTVCDVLQNTNDDLIPEEWDYRPSILGVELDPTDYLTEIFLDTDPKALVKFGKILNRYINFLEYKGLTY